MRPFLDLFFSVFCSFPVSSFPCPFPYSLVPIFFPFFLSSSAVSTFFFLLSWLTTWPSGLRRVTRNHFSSGGVGSNPAVVVFCLPAPFYLRLSPYWALKKWSHPDSNWGPENQNLICCPYTMGPFNILRLLYPSLFFVYVIYSFIISSPKRGHNRIRTNDRGNCSPTLYHWAMRPALIIIFFIPDASILYFFDS